MTTGGETTKSDLRTDHWSAGGGSSQPGLVGERAHPRWRPVASALPLPPRPMTPDADDTDGLRVVLAGIESVAKDRDSVLRRNVDRASASRWRSASLPSTPASLLNELSYP